MRIICNYAYIALYKHSDMKVRLNLTIEGNLLDRVKRYADSKQTSVSELVEDYFKNITKAPRRQNVIDLIEKLGKPSLDTKRDLKKAYYEDQATKYGF